MRFVLKIFAAPFVLALSLTVGVLSFVFSLASWAFSILSLLFAVCALFSIFIEGDTAWGIQGLVILPPFRGRRGQGRRREQQHTEPKNIFGELCQRAAPNQYPALHRR